MALEKRKRWIITPHFDPYDDEDMNDALLHGRTPVEVNKEN